MARDRERRNEENKLKPKRGRGVLPTLLNRMTTRNNATNEDERSKVNKLISEATGDSVVFVESLQVNLHFSRSALICIRQYRNNKLFNLHVRVQEEERLNLVSALGIDVSQQADLANKGSKEDADGWISEDDERAESGAKTERLSVTHKEVNENTGHGAKR